jgi:hypothetical protein
MSTHPAAAANSHRLRVVFVQSANRATFQSINESPFTVIPEDEGPVLGAGDDFWCLVVVQVDDGQVRTDARPIVNQLRNELRTARRFRAAAQVGRRLVLRDDQQQRRAHR